MEIQKGFLLGTFALTLGAFCTPAKADAGQTGVASYYWQGRGTASGERFNPNALTAAHRSLPFGTKVRVTNLRNGRAVVVRINDRGPFVRGRIIDVSRAAASELGFTGHGVTRVSVAVLGREQVAEAAPDQDQAAPAAPAPVNLFAWLQQQPQAEEPAN
ncbi:septal ring lytic transglycosylase RlpA family protein [Roseixanthobacter pseudopolyaromaticivorans]|uniref:septal ring lytic transglycosylase RlpA family protein n=1 Tax=Xanthobacteraceae TaxID=335928 RepID=UPI003728554C